MQNLLIKELYKNTENYFEKEVQVSGWVRTVRDSKSFGFIELNDGSFFKNVQIVFEDTLENFSEICKLLCKIIWNQENKKLNLVIIVLQYK